MQRPTFLEYRNYRYLKLAGLLVSIALLLAVLSPPSYGGTWLGYGLGIAAAALVLLLFWYGIRKRRVPRFADRRLGHRRRQMFAESQDNRRGSDRRKVRPEDHWRHGGTLQGWLSSHIYLGLGLLVLASLHSGLRFGWNIHTLVYVLVVLVVASGLYGTYAYLRYPRRINASLGGDTLDDLRLKIAELDELARVRALGLPDDINALVAAMRRHTRLGGNLLQQLRCRQRHCPTALALRTIEARARELVAGEQPRLMRDLYTVLLQKQQLVARARQVISLNARMQAWLILHAPLAVVLLAALFAHILLMLVFW